MLSWLPPDGMHGRFERFDLRPGGSYRLVLTYDDPTGALGKTSADSDIVEVRIAQLVPGERILQEIDFESDDPAFEGTMQLEWNLRSVEEGTEVEVVARQVPDGIRVSDHARGITSSLANLADYLEP